ncbi:hypothetical protein HMPREF0290_1192 [Corynebacterium efficiens YS-314]|uniref:Uncharacterized protein n=1 Tax=Corynebacterium efficiens (strain DSM 44549 / YS-314 / AJ 12310 / JCM 11189 / NBRC 100395) TaxID=196164 RepID=Q8FS61_COREF|nr:ECF transporter S component [Corynebacterium efficiens]EEW50197.1 hypothetical protein HMPREF0290_1192 [Corynebacterium efficiens YS-314]BAC17353.1 hypothetical protein [Corynebacterium efficiens YS-314]
MISAIALKPKTYLTLGVLAVLSIIIFFWPLIVNPESFLSDDAQAPLYLALVIPLVLAAVVAEISEDGFDVKAVAMLGVLSAMVAIVRPFGAGTAGFEAVFFILILGGRAFGPGFGFILGNTGLFASALLTAGIGPWLPYQMLAAAWVAFGAGLLPPVRGRLETLIIVVYAVVAALGYGFLMNMSFWPYAIGVSTELSFTPGAPVLENLHTFVLFSLTTSLGWDLGRALFTSVLLLLTTKPVLGALRRASRRAAFGVERSFS